MSDDDTTSRLAQVTTRALQLVLAGLLGYGLVTLQFSIVIPVALAVGVTLLPAVLQREYGYTMAPALVLWVTIAMVLHVAGTVGLYQQYQWYDEITHTVSSTLIAGLGYAAFRALERHSEAIDVPAAFRAVFIVVFVLAAGVLWEVIEFGFGGLIPVYGIDDIVTDFMFNAVGAILVALWGTQHVTSLVGFFQARLRSGA